MKDLLTLGGLIVAACFWLLAVLASFVTTLGLPVAVVLAIYWLIQNV